MRKYAWGLGTCGVFVLAATVWSSHYAARHPESLVGRVMHGASYAASKLSPAGGFGPVLAALEKKPAAADEVDGVPADPEPVEGEQPANEAQAIENASAAPIVIPEGDEVCMEDQSAIRPVQHETTFGPETECPADAVCRAPTAMPLCSDGEECEVLPMPSVEADEQENAADEEGPMPKQEPEEIQAQPTELPEGGEGLSSMPAAGGEESSEEASEDGVSGKTALKKMKRYRSRKAIDEGCPTFPTYPSVDTLEMRPSDRHLYEYGPGVL